MDNLDQLIAKFKEVKEELEKSDSPLHDTVEGFMGGLKTLPKGSDQRHQFITSHLAHGPFTDAMAAHPQGKQMSDMLHASKVAHQKAQFAGRGSAGVKAQIGHLDSKANAGLHSSGIRATVGDKTNVIKSVDDELDDFLSKAYFSPFALFGRSKKVKPAVKEGPAKPTGIDKIKAVSQQKIEPTDMTAKKPTAPAPAKKLTGLDRIKAESQKPITATTVKKDEDEEDVEKSLGDMSGKMKGTTSTGLTHPSDMSRANMMHDAMSGAFQPKVAPVVSPKGLKGLDRIKAVGSQPIKKDEDKTHVRFPNKLAPGATPEAGHGYGASGYNTTIPVPKIKPAGMHLESVGGKANSLGSKPDHSLTGEPTVSHRRPILKGEEIGPKFEKTVNGSYAPSTNMAMSCGEKVSLNKGGQWNLDKAEESKCVKCKLESVSNPASGLCDKCRIARAQDKMKAREIPVEKPAAHPPIKKSECSKCHADPCECQTTGVLVDKMDGDVGTGV